MRRSNMDEKWLVIVLKNFYFSKWQLLRLCSPIVQLKKEPKSPSRDFEHDQRIPVKVLRCFRRIKPEVPEEYYYQLEPVHIC